MIHWIGFRWPVFEVTIKVNWFNALNISETRDQGLHKHAASKRQGTPELDSNRGGAGVFESNHFPASIYGGELYYTLTPNAGKMMDSNIPPPSCLNPDLHRHTDIHYGDCTKRASHWASLNLIFLEQPSRATSFGLTHTFQSVTCADLPWRECRKNAEAQTGKFPNAVLFCLQLTYWSTTFISRIYTWKDMVNGVLDLSASEWHTWHIFFSRGQKQFQVVLRTRCVFKLVCSADWGFHIERNYLTLSWNLQFYSWQVTHRLLVFFSWHDALCGALNMPKLIKKHEIVRSVWQVLQQIPIWHTVELE